MVHFECSFHNNGDYVVSKNEMIIEKLTIDDIPAIVCYKKDVKHAPLIIFSHWFSGKKEDLLGEMELYAEKYFFTVSIDNKGHGEREEMRFSEYTMENEKTNILKVRELINETAKDILKVIDFLENDSHIDRKRTGLLYN